MNKTKIEWCDYTWNCVVGCQRGCTYCYAKKIFKRFNPDKKFEDVRFYPDRLAEPFKLKKPSRIFAGSMCDLFADWTDRSYVEDILRVIKKCPQHTFMFLTKSPYGYKKYHYPKNVWLGATVTGETGWGEAVKLSQVKRDNLKYLSIEPVLERIDTCYFLLLDWIIIGGLTPKPVHKTKWITDFLELNEKIKKPIFLKDNLHYPEVIKEFPKARGA